MSDDDDDDGVDKIAAVVSQLVKSLGASTVTLKLLNGSTVAGSIAGINLRKKERKGNVSWNGTISIETEPGTLQIDCLNIGSISSK